MYRDSWKYNDDHCSPDELAGKYNLWLRLDGRWYTPKEFHEDFYGKNHVRYKGVELLNPLWAIQQAREVIEEMIVDQKTVSSILNAMDRLNKFTDRLFKEGFKKIPGQVDSMKWPAQPYNPNVKPFLSKHNNSDQDEMHGA